MAGQLPPSKVLLVEGVDDKHVVRHLCERHQSIPNFDILDKNGFPELKAAIVPELKVSGRIALGILVDANLRPTQRWQQISHQLQQAAISPPAQIALGGTIVGNRPRVGIWLMPDNVSAGQLEDFIKQLMPASDPVWPRAQSYIDGIPEAERKFAPGKIERARIHAWLAARAEPRKMGTAIGAGDLDAKAPLAIQLIDWLQRLFN